MRTPALAAPMSSNTGSNGREDRTTPLHDRARELGSPTPRSQAYEGARGPWIEVRAALAGEMREEEQPLGTRLDFGRLRDQGAEVGRTPKPLAPPMLDTLFSSGHAPDVSATG
jgi:hypothetical protein